MANWKFYLDGNEVEEPIGWDAIEFTAIRMDSHGIDQPFSTEVKFYDKGAKYIKAVYDQYFINQPIAITITSDVGYNNSPYQFDGFLNMAIYQEHNVCDTDSWEITVGIIDDNFREQFKARQDVEIDLNATKDLNGNTISALTERQIRLHKQDLYLQANGKNLADSTTYLRNGPSGPNFNRYAIVPTFWQQKDFVENYGSVFDANALFVVGDGNLPGYPIFKNNASTTRTISYEISIDFDLQSNDTTGNIVVELSLLQFNGNIPQAFPPSVLLYAINLAPSQFVNVNNTYTGTFTVGVGITVALMFGQFTFSTVNQAVDVTIRKGYTINFSEINSGEYASTANCLTIEQWLRRSIYVMTGSNNKLLSDAFSESGNGCYWNNALTNGLRIRQADSENNLGSLKTSWKNIFEALDKIFCIGWAFEWDGSEWKIRVEPREYFYQNLISSTFNNVGEVTQMPKVELIMNNITLGYTDTWKNIQLSGVFAIHTDRNYFIANRAMAENSTAKLDMRTSIIAEGYAIEFSRRLSGITFGGATSDRPNDYETFIIWINRNEITVNPVQLSEYRLPQEIGSVTFPIGTVSVSSDRILTSNSPLGGLYNIYHTPARVAARWWKVLGMHTYGLSNPRLQFQVGQYQTTYSSAIEDSTEPCLQYPTGYVLPENTDIYAGILNDQNKQYLFKPIEIQFIYPQSLCDFLTLSQDEQYRKVRLTSGSLDVQGFITEATNQPEDASGGTTKFTLLMSAQDALEGGAFSDGFSDGFDIDG